MRDRHDRLASLALERLSQLRDVAFRSVERIPWESAGADPAGV